jgi:hypothetical protein
MTTRPLSQLPVAVARVACSGGTHAIRWEGGDLVALDHDDPEGERALAALGGQSCTCLDILGAWARQRGDAALLSALSRGSQDPVQTEGLWPGPFAAYRATTLPRNVATAGRGGMWRGGAGLTSSLSVVTGVATPGAAMGQHSGSSFTDDDDVVLLAGLGHQLTLRLAATVTAALLNQLDSPQGLSPRPSLEASLFGRASAALRTWLGKPELELELAVVEPDEEPTLDWDVGSPVHLALPLEWVMTVWGCDLTVVAGRFCLGVAESKGTRTTLMSVGSDLGVPRPLSIELL